MEPLKFTLDIVSDLPDGRVFDYTFTPGLLATRFLKGHVDPEMIRDLEEHSRNFTNNAIYVFDGEKSDNYPIRFERVHEDLMRMTLCCPLIRPDGLRYLFDRRTMSQAMCDEINEALIDIVPKSTRFDKLGEKDRQALIRRIWGH
jgi:hypothetical protein